jgi:hypothetical protein
MQHFPSLRASPLFVIECDRYLSGFDESLRECLPGADSETSPINGPSAIAHERPSHERSRGRAHWHNGGVPHEHMQRLEIGALQLQQRHAAHTAKLPSN